MKDRKPLLVPDGPPPMSSGVEVYIAKCHNLFTGIYVGEIDRSALDEIAVTVLVSFSTAASDRMALWPLRNALSFARCSSTVLDGTDWLERLQKLVASADASSGTATVFVGSGASLVAETVQSAIDVLNQVLEAVLVVSERDRRWNGLRGVAGFVRGARATTGETARQAFLALSVLMAPKTLTGIDWIDLLAVLGSAETPSVLAEAIWCRNGTGRLIAMAPEDELAVLAGDRVVAIPFIDGLTLSELIRLHRVWTAEGDARRPIVFAALNPLQPGLLPSGAGLVLMLCHASTVQTTPRPGLKLQLTLP